VVDGAALEICHHVCFSLHPLFLTVPYSFNSTPTSLQLNCYTQQKGRILGRILPLFLLCRYKQKLFLKIVPFLAVDKQMP